MKRFCLGDIHGEYDKLCEVLEKSGIDKDNDLLIQVGDIVDRGPEPFKCYDKLLEFKNRILLMGNHDEALLSWIKSGNSSFGSYSVHNGQTITIKKYLELDEIKQKIYLNLLEKLDLYHLTEDRILFVHAGINGEQPIEKQHPMILIWDRDFVGEVMNDEETPVETKDTFTKIFIGHTPTIYWDIKEPIFRRGVWNIDTGCGKGGLLTIMNIDSEEYWQA